MCVCACVCIYQCRREPVCCSDVVGYFFLNIFYLLLDFLYSFHSTVQFARLASTQGTETKNELAVQDVWRGEVTQCYIEISDELDKCQFRV